MVQVHHEFFSAYRKSWENGPEHDQNSLQGHILERHHQNSTQWANTDAQASL